MKKMFCAMFLFAITVLSFSAFAANPNTIAVHPNSTECSATITSSAILTDPLNVSLGFDYRFQINISTRNETFNKTCTVSLTTFKNVTAGSGVIRNATNGAHFNFSSNYSDGNGRYIINWSSEKVLVNGSTQLYNVTITFAANLAKETNLTQRIISQKRVQIQNVAEIDLVNIYSSGTYYYDWTTSTLKVFECTTNDLCASTVGAATGKTAITLLQNDTTNYITKFLDTNLSANTVANYSVEGELLGNDAYYYAVENTGSQASTGSQPQQTVTPVQPALEGITPTQAQGFLQQSNLVGNGIPNGAVILIIIILVIVVVVLVAKKI